MRLRFLALPNQVPDETRRSSAGGPERTAPVGATFYRCSVSQFVMYVYRCTLRPPAMEWFRFG